MTQLHIKNVQKKYKSRFVVNGISMTLNKGEIAGLLGPNGAGKTTTFYMTVGLVQPTHGQIFLDDRDITALPIHKRAQLGIGYLPQERSIFRKLTVSQNILAILERRKDLNKQQRLEKRDQLLNEFHITHLKDTMAISLSGGETRRVEIARALAINPQFILLDEPFAGIDPISIIDIKRIITHLQQRNIGVLITDHNVRETLDICQKAYIVDQGQLIATGSADDILNNEQVRDVYLGHEFAL
ncbi:MAG: LPS export ABC transporter ATP-binding protein [Coxiellaceae bacterium]|nr:LPS export ABC transporter ATP-binding protein [Coxiellaceae bacterium]|tara:strand:+ start:4392 stop:5117 length:726 start_codon:yes stop_codon:yes gene_type:complete